MTLTHLFFNVELRCRQKMLNWSWLPPEDDWVSLFCHMDEFRRVLKTESQVACAAFHPMVRHGRRGEAFLDLLFDYVWFFICIPLYSNRNELNSNAFKCHDVERSCSCGIALAKLSMWCSCVSLALLKITLPQCTAFLSFPPAIHTCSLTWLFSDIPRYSSTSFPSSYELCFIVRWYPYVAHFIQRKPCPQPCQAGILRAPRLVCHSPAGKGQSAQRNRRTSDGWWVKSPKLRVSKAICFQSLSAVSLKFNNSSGPWCFSLKDPRHSRSTHFLVRYVRQSLLLQLCWRLSHKRGSSNIILVSRQDYTLIE